MIEHGEGRKNYQIALSFRRRQKSTSLKETPGFPHPAVHFIKDGFRTIMQAPVTAL